jgi:hypothetical protein
VQEVEELAGQHVRRSSRIPKEIAILLTGCDANGKQFIENTKTVVLSRYGAGIVSKHKLVVEQELILVHTESNKEAEIRIVGQIGSANGSYTYGVAFLHPEVDFWGVEFPSLTVPEISAGNTPFQCTICGCREVIGQEALELDVYAVHGAILRDCKQCVKSTLWKNVSGMVPESAPLCEAPASSGQATPSETRSATVPGKNRRKHHRIKVNFTACIRNPGSEDRLVQCENVSRGGLCFKSNKCYYETSRVEVAAPYTPGSPCILVPAEIVHVQELPEEGMFRCGVQYLDLTKDPLAA